MGGRYIEDTLAESLKKFYCAGYEELKSYHREMLSSITGEAPLSPVYSGRISKTDRLETLPMTCWEDIEASMNDYGLEKTFLAKPVRFWQTSGYSGTPKRIYYGNSDLERMYLYILEMLYITGAAEQDMHISNVGVEEPNLPGTLFDECFAQYGSSSKKKITYVSWTASDEQSLVNILKGLSKVDEVNMMLSYPVLYYLIALASKDPSWLESKVVPIFSHLVFLPMPVLPRPFAKWIAGLYLRDIDYGRINIALDCLKAGYVYGEPLEPYMPYLSKSYPSMKIFNILGSTELLIQAFHLSGDPGEMSVVLKHFIPELAFPEDVSAAKEDPGRKLKAVPWFEWEKGMRGELMITRPGECLPLIRYPTGDYVEVVDPARTTEVTLEGVSYKITLPVIRVLSRTMDIADFDAPCQSGTFFGFKFYSKNLNDAMTAAGNVKWWEFYKLRGIPGRYVLYVIPEAPVKDPAAIKKAIIASLLKDEINLAVPFGLAEKLDALELIIAKPEAYSGIEYEMEKRTREGRPIGRIKPRHIYTIDSEGEFNKILKEKSLEPMTPRPGLWPE